MASHPQNTTGTLNNMHAYFSVYLFLVPFVVLVCYRVCQLLCETLSNRRFARSRNCKAAKEYPSPALGVTMFLASVRAARQDALLEFNRSRFLEIGAKTYTMMNLGKRVTYTMESENLKAMLATDFRSWALEQRRKDS